MGRKKKITTEKVMKYAREYFSIVCHGDIHKMTYKNIAAYITQKTSVNVMDYDLKKEPLLKKYILDIKKNSNNEITNTIVYFKRIDINSFLQINNTELKLRKAIVNLDSKYEKICTLATNVFKENENLTKRNELLLAKNNKLKEELDKYMTIKDENLNKSLSLKNELKQSQERVRTLLSIINTYVYPEIANKLLEENGLLHINDSPISDTGLENVMKDTDSVVSFIDYIENKKNNDIIENLMSDLEFGIEGDE